MGTAHLYRLSDLLLLARRKHGGVGGLEQRLADKAEGAAKRKRATQDAADARQEELAAALAPVGMQLR